MFFFWRQIWKSVSFRPRGCYGLVARNAFEGFELDFQSKIFKRLFLETALGELAVNFVREVDEIFPFCLRGILPKEALYLL
jgi:hypothetical protein